MIRGGKKKELRKDVKDKVESKCGGVQEKWATRKVYSKDFVWVG